MTPERARVIWKEAIINVISLLRLNKFQPPLIGQTKLPPDVQYLRAHFETWKPGTRGNTPMAILYRMYENIVIDDEKQLRKGIRYFYAQPKWHVSTIPDPCDPDPARYAILAALTGILVKSLNLCIAQGLPREMPGVPKTPHELEMSKAQPPRWQKEPGWAARVKPLEERLELPTRYGYAPQHDELASVPFLEKNISTFEPNIDFDV
ncbi:MAG: hypothetical protein M1822_001727 [Bathelium mastoideum]|nr:MAG: hypothetical protein M1822_001727 [Bathelium mastoideum]